MVNNTYSLSRRCYHLSLSEEDEMIDKKTASFSRQMKKGFVAGFLSPLSAVCFGREAKIPVAPSFNVRTGSFSSDLEKIGLDFSRALRYYAEQQSESQK